VKIALSDKPVAWQLFVRRLSDGKAYHFYSTYDSHKQALATLKAVEGPPLECKLIPLYRELTNEDLK